MTQYPPQQQDLTPLASAEVASYLGSIGQRQIRQPTPAIPIHQPTPAIPIHQPTSAIPIHQSGLPPVNNYDPDTVTPPADGYQFPPCYSHSYQQTDVKPFTGHQPFGTQPSGRSLPCQSPLCNWSGTNTMVDLPSQTAQQPFTLAASPVKREGGMYELSDHAKRSRNDTYNSLQSGDGNYADLDDYGSDYPANDSDSLDRIDFKDLDVSEDTQSSVFSHESYGGVLEADRGTVMFSRQPQRTHRPQYPTSEGSRGCVRDDNKKPTQIQFTGVTGNATIRTSIVTIEGEKSPDYELAIIQSSKRAKDGRSTSVHREIAIRDGTTHDLDYVGIQVKTGGGPVKKRNKECRIKVDCDVMTNCGERYKMSALSDILSCSQEGKMILSNLKPPTSEKCGGAWLLIEGKNLKQNVQVVFEEIAGGIPIWSREIQPSKSSKDFVLVEIPEYPNSINQERAHIDVFLYEGSHSNRTNSNDFYYVKERTAERHDKPTQTGIPSSIPSTLNQITAEQSIQPMTCKVLSDRPDPSRQLSFTAERSEAHGRIPSPSAPRPPTPSGILTENSPSTELNDQAN